MGKRLNPDSEKTFKNKRDATVVNDTIDFYGALINVDVHNSYKSRLFNRGINIAAERIVSLKESGIECHVDRHLIHIKMNKSKKVPGKEKYGGFPWEMKRQHLKNFPVIFDFDENYQSLIYIKSVMSPASGGQWVAISPVVFIPLCITSRHRQTSFVSASQIA